MIFLTTTGEAKPLPASNITAHSAPCAEPRHFPSSGTTWATPWKAWTDVGQMKGALHSKGPTWV